MPPLAASKQPIRALRASVKAPRSCPKSSASTSGGGIAALVAVRRDARALHAAPVMPGSPYPRKRFSNHGGPLPGCRGQGGFDVIALGHSTPWIAGGVKGWPKVANSAASALGVSGIPALFLIRDGKIVAQTAGAMPASQIVSWARQALGKLAA